MRVFSRTPYLLLGALALALILTFVGWPASQASSAPPAPAQASYTCSWKDLGNLNRTVAYAASAIDTDNAVMYVYGGYSEPSANWQTQSQVSGITFGATLSRGDTAVANVSSSGSKDREALAGVYRSKGDDSAIYWIGGRDNSGKTSSDVYRYTIKTKAWEMLSTAGSFSTRNEHAAAYDPEHDVIWVAAGEISACTSVPCTAPQMPTQYLQFDAATGAASWQDGPSGGPRAKGGTMVYDSSAKRMLFFGGTIDGGKGTNQLYELDLTDPDVTKAKWSSLGAGGTAPQVAVHGAAYDPDRNWMVVYGGMKANYADPGRESGESRTFALDLSESPPAWKNLNTTVGERIQGVMEYLPKHQAVIFASGRDALADPVEDTVFKRNIYGLACTEIVPTATLAPTDTPDPSIPTNTPSGPGPGPTWEPPQPDPAVCPGLDTKVPQAAIDNAVANPDSTGGWMQLCNPNLPISPWNQYRDKLALRSPSKPFNLLFNGLVWKCGCP